MLMKAFITSRFYYCLLFQMFHIRNTENRVNKSHERALKLVYDGRIYLRLDELLAKDKWVSIHQTNIQFPSSETFKVKNWVSTRLTQSIFQFVKKPYNLRNNSELLRKRNWTVFYGTESLPSLATQIRKMIPPPFDDEPALSRFKGTIKTSTTTQCPCRLCKKYEGPIGFI